MKKAVCLILAVFMLSACDVDFLQESAPDTIRADAPSRTVENISLPFNDDDSLNPYRAATTFNLGLMPLIYDFLIKLDNEYIPYPEICESAEMTEGNLCRITLRSDVRFWDGSPLTADDVVYSLSAAKESGYYSHKLADAAQIRKVSASRVEITLSKEDVFFTRNLDIPIVKADSLTAADAVGSGRYRPMTEGNRKILKFNTEWYKEADPKYKEITLTHLPGSETIMSSLRAGTINMLFDDLSDSLPSVIGINSLPVVMNNLVFMGINGNSHFTSSPKVRQGLSAAISRNIIRSRAYSEHGRPALLPIVPVMKFGDFAQDKDGFNASPETANAILDEAGWSIITPGGYRMPGGEILTLTMIVNRESVARVSAARSIESGFKQIGVRVAVEELDRDTYINRINAGQYDLYIGEIKLGNNMDIQPFINGAASVNMNYTTEFLTAYNKFRQDGDINTFDSVFRAEMPFVPLLFREGLLLYSNSMNFEINTTISDLFINFENYRES